MKICSSKEQYLEPQSNMIRERINKFGGKLPDEKICLFFAENE